MLLLLLCFLIRQIARLFMVQTVQFSSNIMIGIPRSVPLVLQRCDNELHSKNSLRERDSKRLHNALKLRKYYNKHCVF